MTLCFLTKEQVYAQSGNGSKVPGIKIFLPGDKYQLMKILRVFGSWAFILQAFGSLAKD
jgi:hypothetical protein